MPSYPLTFPSVGVTNSRFALTSVVSESVSQFTGAQQVHKHPGSWFEGEVTFRPMSYSERGQITAFLANLRGKFGTFSYGDPDYLARGPVGAPVTVATSTNNIRNGQAGGASAGVVGAGGALPTNWAVDLPNGLTTEVIGSGTESGFNYVEIKVSGSPSGTNYRLRFDGNTQIAAALGEQWASSFYIKSTGGSLTNIGATQITTRENDGAGTGLTQTDTAFTLTSSYTRATGSRTFNNASTAYANMMFRFTTTAAAAVDLTFRIAAPQLEKQASATPYIPTTSADVTRPAGVTVTVGSQTGNSLIVQGYAASAVNSVKAGDYIQLGIGSSAKLYMITADASADFMGRVTIPLEPELRASPAANDAVTFTGAKGVFRLVDNSAQWSSDASCINLITIAFREVL